MRLLDDWRGLLGRHVVATTRQLLRKVLDRQRFVFYPKGRGADRWYDLGVTPTPTLDRFLAAVPMLKKAGMSPSGIDAVCTAETPEIRVLAPAA
jgi:hypothetical protein